VSGPILMFCAADSFSVVPRASGPVFMFYSLRLVFDGIKGVGSRFHVLRSRTHFRRFRGRIFGGTEGVGSRFHVLQARTSFRRYGGCRVPYSCFARLDSFSTVLRMSGPVFIFCAPGHVFGGVECVGSRFHVLCAQTHFRRSRER
jgi:hypothetical protein